MNPLQIRRMMEALGEFTVKSVVNELLRIHGPKKHPRTYLMKRVQDTVVTYKRTGKVEVVDKAKKLYRWVKPPSNQIELLDPPGPPPVDLTDFSHPESGFWRDRARDAKSDGPQTRGT